MSQPQTIGAYLAALNAVLEVGLRSRRRILLELEDHLDQAAQDELHDGASPEEAQRRAIAAFGSPQEVAARFEAGLLAAVDRRLALSTRWLHRWTTRRPRTSAVMWIALAIVIGAMVAAVGAAFGARQPLLAATPFLISGMLRALQHIVDPSWKDEVAVFFAFSPLFAYLFMVDGLDGAAVEETIALAFGTQVLAWTAIRKAVKRSARRYPGAAEDDRRQAWKTDRPWLATVADVAPLPLGVVMLIVVHSGPGGLRIALAALTVAMAALALGALRLEQSRQQKEDYQHAYGDRAT